MRYKTAIIIAFLLGLIIGIAIKSYLPKENIRVFLKSINDNYASAISALFSLGMLLVAIIMCITLLQNRKILKLHTKTLELQQNEFKLRNRPLVDATEARFGGPLISHQGYKYPHTVEIKLENKRDIPATQFKAICRVMIDNEEVRNNTIEVGVLTQGTPWQGIVFLTKEIYLDATENKKKFSINVVATYSGMLEEKADEYGTSFVIIYFTDQHDFRFAHKKFR